MRYFEPTISLPLLDTLSEVIGLEGGIRLVLTAMESHPVHGKLLRNACAALGNLLSNGNDFPFLARGGAYVLILRVFNV